MGYFTEKISEQPFEETREKIIEELKKEGFGVLTEIDVQKTLKEKLNADFRKYKILGACNPPSAYEALQAEENIGLMLPCNVVVQEMPDGRVKVAAINPAESMQAVHNPKLEALAAKVSTALKKAVDRL